MFPIESLSGITTFVAAARAQSFTDAAEGLGISKSAVGKSIARLEERLGVKLFHRTTRQISLTTDGEAFFAACTTALDEIADAEAILCSRSHKPSGRLRIDMPVAFGRRVMVPILMQIGKEYPDLQFALTFSDHIIDPIEEGLDLVIRFGEVKDSSDLVARKLTAQRWVVIASPEYLKKRSAPNTVEEIQGHCAIVGYRRGQPLSWRFNQEGKPVRVAPPATHQIGDGEAMIELALAGMGLCQMPLSLVRHYIESGRLMTVLDNFTTDPVGVYAVWPKVAHLRPKVRYVVDTLVELGKKGELD